MVGQLPACVKSVVELLENVESSFNRWPFKEKLVKPLMPVRSSLKWNEYLPIFFFFNLRIEISWGDLFYLYLIAPYFIVKVWFCMYSKQIALRSTSKLWLPCLVITWLTLFQQKFSTIYKVLLQSIRQSIMTETSVLPGLIA